MAVLAVKQLGAERIIAMSRHPERQELACFYGATDIVEERGDQGVARIEEQCVDPGWVPTRMGGPRAPDDLRLGHLTD